MTANGVKTSEDVNTITALIALQAELPVIPFDKTNPHFKNKFASLGAIREKIQPLLAKHGFAWVTCPTVKDGQPALDYSLRHRSGESIDGTMLLLIGPNATAQAQGAAITYARRYAQSAVLGLVADEDDDGNHASNPSPRGAAPATGADSRTAPTGRKAEVMGLCPVCAELGLRANGDKDPALFKDSRTGRIQCNGRLPGGDYANHGVEPTEPVDDVDSTAIPF